MILLQVTPEQEANLGVIYCTDKAGIDKRLQLRMGCEGAARWG